MGQFHIVSDQISEPQNMLGRQTIVPDNNKNSFCLRLRSMTPISHEFASIRHVLSFYTVPVYFHGTQAFLSDPEKFVSLHTQTPLRMRQAVANGGLCVLYQVWPIHGLQIETRERERFEALWFSANLGEH